MKHLLELLKWDHQRFTTLLNYLAGVVEGLDTDEEPDYREFIELITYLKPALKGSHQAEELALWRRLSYRIGSQRETVRRLEELHQAVVGKGLALESGIRAAQEGTRLPLERLQRLADDFANAFREQMAIEEQTIFPLLESVMPEHEWYGDTAGTANNDQPRGGGS